MSLKLEPMTQKTVDEIYENSIHEYAHEHIKSGDWEAEGAIERARSDFEKLLPYGLATENQDLFSVIYLNEIIGYCWLHFEGIKKKDRKSTRLNSSHVSISYAVFCLKKKKKRQSKTKTKNTEPNP